MGRHREISDIQLMEGVLAAIERVGVTRLSFDEIAENAGASKATAVRRFGSKEALLLDFVRWCMDGTAPEGGLRKPAAALLVAAGEPTGGPTRRWLRDRFGAELEALRTGGDPPLGFLVLLGLFCAERVLDAEIPDERRRALLALPA